MSNSKVTQKILVFIGFLVFGILLAGLARRSLHPDFWWLGLLMGALFLQSLRADFLEPLRNWKKLGKERVALNLKATAYILQNQSKGASRTRQTEQMSEQIFARFYLRLFPLALPLLVLFGPAFAKEVSLWSSRLARALEPSTLTLRIEPPAFSSQKNINTQLTPQSSFHAAVTAGSYIDLQLSGGAGLGALTADMNDRPQSNYSQIKLIAFAKNPNSSQTPEKIFQAQLGRAGNWSGSTGLLTEALELNPKESSQVVFIIQSETQGTEDSKGFRFELSIEPSPVPLASLSLTSSLQQNRNHSSAADASLGTGPDEQEIRETLNLSGENGGADQSTLTFTVEVTSETPLTQVELLVRTQSGYKFNMPIGEFTGTDRLTFNSSEVRLQTLGIPFTETDTLFVQVKAQTVVKELYGLSNELSFPVKSPQQARKQLIEQLEKILESMHTPPPQFEAMKNELMQKLEKSILTARELGKQSQAARALTEAHQQAQSMREPSQKDLNSIESKVKDTLETLKRRQAQDQASSWFMKTKAFLDKLENSTFTDKEIAAAKKDLEQQELLEEASDLTTESTQLKEKLTELVDAQNSGLTLEEKQLALELLDQDETPLQMESMTDQIQAMQKEEALNQGKETLAQANQNLGGLLQLIAVARARIMREAKEKLSKADENLENTRQSLKPEEQEKEAKQAQNQLDGTPELGESFNKALSEAREGSKGVRRALRQGEGEELIKQLDQSQRAIAEALAALQEEEQSSREERSEEEGKRFRSAMDAMNAQGQLDSGWRKKIFQEISRLREKGVPADADIIRYLESRLR